MISISQYPVFELLVANCIGDSWKDEYQPTIVRLAARNEDHANGFGGLRHSVWRAFYRRHPHMLHESSDFEMLQLGRQLAAEIATEDAVKAITDLLIRHKI